MGTEASSECYNETAAGYAIVNNVSPGETVNDSITGLEAYIGYGTHEAGVMADYFW